MLNSKYMKLPNQQKDLLAAICFYTNDVRLVVEGSPVIEKLKVAEEKGVRLIVCSPSWNYFSLPEMMKIGIVGEIGNILNVQWKAGKVITL